MSHPRVEEVSDSDMSDPSEGDIDDFADGDIMRQRQPAPQPAASSQQQQQQQQQFGLFNPANAAPSGRGPGPLGPSDVAGYQCLYPIYFDASHTRAEGRRVSAALAVRNPLAREIANACAALRLQPVFEAHKTHPQDWANPGRVRVNLKDGNNSNIKNKHHLYLLVAAHLRQNPTTEKSAALRGVVVPGVHMPRPDEPWPRPDVPRGWKVNELLPAYSAAMALSGMNEDALKDMMSEMGGGMPGMGGMPGGPDMMNMLSAMGAGGPGLGGGSGAAADAGAGPRKKEKKGKGRA